MQARNPCESFCLQKAWHAQFLRKEPRIVCAATPQMPSENQLRIALDFHGAVSVPKAAPYETDLLEDTAKAKALSRKQMLRG